MNKSFANSFVLVSGAASGIGRELVQQLYLLQAKILAVDIDEDGLKGLKAQLPEIEILTLDLTKGKALEEITFWLAQNWKQLDYCFANAGKAYYEPFQKQELNKIEELFHLNVIAVLELGIALKKTFPVLYLTITCSAMAYWPLPGYGVYSATKSSLLAWAQAVWLESDEQWLSLAFPIATQSRFFEQEGQRIPRPFPSQTADQVAGKILRGVKNRQKKIFPSTLFQVLLYLNRYLLIIKPIYQYYELRKFKKWIKKQSSS
ncbi:SDR family NAD(P)-dependent oxidoreductase [Algoriphagus algorifonticola]|uniref:SDR family NAD(P)-dependent oxidoreductase n=1 Tax=Algoriphagus algorifonticola TaxID=2593007 RepID=UPI00119E1FDC|nr:SDR family NAD(P)-dependent oxidoreductase [Algoriphagus algorifonticola]